MQRIIIAALLGLLLVAAGGSAQPHGTNLLATTTAGLLYRITPLGHLHILMSFQALPNMVAMDGNDRDVLVLTYQPPSLVVVDPTANAIVRTLWNGQPLYRADYFNPLHDGGFVVSGTTLSPYLGALIHVRADGSATTLRVGAPLRGPQAVLQDLTNGDVLAGDLTGQTLFDVALDGTIATLSVSTLHFPFSMAQDHTDGSILVGPGGRSWLWGFFRLDRRTRKITTLTGPGIVLNANAMCFDRWRGTGEIVVGAEPVFRIDGQGTVITSYSGLPWNNTGLCFEQGRNVVTARISPPNEWRIDLHFPGDAGRPYVLGFSFSGFTPGIAVDSRAIPLNPDDLLRLSLNGSLAGYLKGGTGVLDAQDRARAVLDLRQLGNVLHGVRIWAAAVTLDGRAPSGLQTISKPVVLVLD